MSVHDTYSCFDSIVNTQIYPTQIFLILNHQPNRSFQNLHMVENLSYTRFAPLVTRQHSIALDQVLVVVKPLLELLHLV